MIADVVEACLILSSNKYPRGLDSTGWLYEDQSGGRVMGIFPRLIHILPAAVLIISSTQTRPQNAIRTFENIPFEFFDLSIKCLYISLFFINI